MTAKPDTRLDKVSLLEILVTFLRIGAASFSLAALGEAKKLLVQQKKWFSDEDYLQGVALSQLIPGAPAFSLMTYLGYRLRGFWGAMISACSYMLPAFLLMVLLTHLYQIYGDLDLLSNLFTGLGALVVGLVVNTVLGLWQSGVKSRQNLLLAVMGFALIYFAKLNIYWILLSATLLSITFIILARYSSWWKNCMAAERGIKQQQRFTPQPINWQKQFITVGWVTALTAGALVLFCQNEVYMNLGKSFSSIGGLVFGSGYAMLPFFQEASVDRFAWITSREFTVALALALVTPGPITKIVTFVGYKAAGLPGALVATTAMYLPSFCVLNLTTDLYRRAGQVTAVRMLIKGVVAAFIGTLWAVVIRLTTDILVDIPTVIFALAAFAVQRYTRIDTLWIIIAGAVLSLIVFNVL
ncbi:chromate transporter [Desulfohalotomaculum tongense]|uniref:chromate efflux transporter n=1 Tax=Desulforadius tongensis TaxID=1216062 RepID=UPI00195B00A5|nr:chromate efflux transporter [Desulforadius tongensis]MBM7854724.1 chromate transporter [Desulforadius tongensis]